MVESQSTQCWASFVGVSWGREDIEVLLLWLGSALLAYPQTEFGAVAPGHVEAMALLTGAVRRGGFGIGDAMAFALGACEDGFSVSGDF